MWYLKLRAFITSLLKNKSGANAVEFAIVVPVLLLIILGIMPHDVSIQAGHDVWTDEDGHNLTCPSSSKSYGGPVAGYRPRLVD